MGQQLDKSPHAQAAMIESPLGCSIGILQSECRRLWATTIGKLVRTDFISLVFALAVCLPTHSLAQAPLGVDAPVPEFGARKIFFMLFLMLGPIKVLVPFVTMSSGSDPRFRRRLATRATLFSAAALAVAGVLGRVMLENFEISLSVLAMTGGVILFLVALQTVLQQPAGALGEPQDFGKPENLSLAFTPLAFPTIVTPYGIAAVIVFATLGHWAPRSGIRRGRNCVAHPHPELAGDAFCGNHSQMDRNRIADIRGGAWRDPGRSRPAGDSSKFAIDRCFRWRRELDWP
jgi:hypothetical protein